MLSQQQITMLQHLMLQHLMLQEVQNHYLGHQNKANQEDICKVCYHISVFNMKYFVNECPKTVRFQHEVSIITNN